MIFGINFNDLITLDNILLTSLLVTILDLVLDPIAVDEGRWKWQSPGKYYGIPIKNFFGWFLNTVIILFFYELFSKEHFLNEKFEFYVTYSPGILFMLLPPFFKVLNDSLINLILSSKWKADSMA